MPRNRKPENQDPSQIGVVGTQHLLKRQRQRKPSTLNYQKITHPKEL